jgi:hypothetical protein
MKITDEFVTQLLGVTIFGAGSGQVAMIVNAHVLAIMLMIATSMMGVMLIMRQYYASKKKK